MKQIFLIVMLTGLFFSNIKANPKNMPTDIVVNSGKYDIKFYHINYTLSTGNFVLVEDSTEDDGFFEILVNKEAFPIPAPNCRNKIILRMPSSSNMALFSSNIEERTDAEKSVELKKALHHQIKEVAEGKLKELNVVVELNPYVRVTSSEPLKLQLDFCNVYFRTYHNYYVNNLDLITPRNNDSST